MPVKIFAFTSIILIGITFGSEPKYGTGADADFDFGRSRLGKIGDYPFPTNPMNDRAKGYLLKGKVKSAVSNYGNFITWDDHPAALWGDYTYLPHVSFVAGVPGQAYSSRYDWDVHETIGTGDVPDRKVWCSREAYNDWFSDGDTNFVGILFNAEEDRGDVGTQVLNVRQIDDINQWCFSNDTLFISVEGVADPNNPRSRIGLIRPWALRPKLKERGDDFDIYYYGDDQEEWTADDDYMYYGANVAESWFTRWRPSTNTEWHAANKARINTHNTDVDAGDLFSDTPFSYPGDSYPLLAHSSYSTTWPSRFNEETGEEEPFWPGWWAEDYHGGNPNWISEHPECSGTRKDPDCWEIVEGRFISDNDVYMEFDDRWAHRSNIVNTNNEYEQTGYPMGFRVKAEVHSYGVSYAEDILFVTVRARNESGDWCATDEDGNMLDEFGFVTNDPAEQLCGEGMIMPDGTKLNRGKGFNYKDMYLGFYMDADAASTDIYGNFWPHTNADDFMEYYDERFYVAGDSLIISMAMIYDYDGNSNGVTDLAIVATQMLDTPKATEVIDLDGDGFPDRYPGESLKMTDWHWFDWYNRPGVVERESNMNCCAGAKGRPQARNREEILYKVIAGDTTNISSDEKDWFFHTPYPDTDLDTYLNPHFDSIEGLYETDEFTGGPEPGNGLDCVLIMSCGPFDVDVGEEVPFSFCIIFGQNKFDLIKNARFAQIMYNSHYQGYTPPTKPTIISTLDHGKVTLTWGDEAELAKDVVTGYTDFEGYKIYKSIDGGKTWGGPEDKIYDISDILVGWRPIAQFDLSAEKDSAYCVRGFEEDGGCVDGIVRGGSISGPDPMAPWFHLGNDTGLDDEFWLNDSLYYFSKINDSTYTFIDYDVHDGIEYTYSVTAYDMGVETPISTRLVPIGNGQFQAVVDTNYSNPDGWSSPDGYESIECSKGTTVHDRNFITVTPGHPAEDDLDEIKVVPNPYIVHSRFNETEYVKRLRFTHLPQICEITIYTISGEKVQTLNHETGGSEWWNLRTVNNQEIAPGLYLYTVESGDKKFIGKFAVVR